MTHDEKNAPLPDGHDEFERMMLEQRKALEAVFDKLDEKVQKLIRATGRIPMKTCAGCEFLTSRWAGGADGYDVTVCGVTEQIVPSTVPDWCPLEKGYEGGKDGQRTMV